MSATTLIKGRVRNGVIIPDGGLTLPDGLIVDIAYPSKPSAISHVQTEFEAWDRAGDDAWSMIDQWETEEPK